MAATEVACGSAGTGTDGVVPPASALSDAVLSGRFFTSRHAAAANATAAFAQQAGGEALLAWLGEADAIRLAQDPDVLRGRLDRDIAAIDALIAAQVDAILHHPRLLRLEGSWRGAAWLVQGLQSAARVKVKLLSLGWGELCRDLERAAEFDQSWLFRKVYEDEFGSPGGEPYGLLVVDHEVRHRPGAGAVTDDVSAIALLAGVAAAAFAPTVLAASPALLGVDDFEDLATITDLSGSFHGPEHARWRALASREDLRFLAVALPRMLARPPWRDDPERRDGFRYAEQAPQNAERVWTTAGYAFAACAARAFAAHAWPADVRGVDVDRIGGGLVTDLPAEPFHSHPNDAWAVVPLDLALTDVQEHALVDLGLMPLGALGYTPDAVFGSVRSLQAPAQFGTAEPRFAGPNAGAARANARLSSQMNSMLCVSRFAHYVKMLGREMVGGFRTAPEIEARLQEWLLAYVNGNLASGPEQRARFPLVNGRVSVQERAGRPGVFACTILLQPHFQLDDVSASFRLVTDIVAPGAR